MTNPANQPGERAVPTGIVVAANRRAAEAGAGVLRGGGNAADAAVATAAALAVVDPANCGIGGHGGFAVVHRLGDTPYQVAFNATVARAHREEPLTGRRLAGHRVTPPSIVAGLCALGTQFGRLPRSETFGPAIALARNGFPVGPGLAHALAWGCARHRGLNDAFRKTFFFDGAPLASGAVLRQPALADTLERIATEGSDSLRRGPLVQAMLETVNDNGGQLAEEDFRSIDPRVAAAAVGHYGGADVWASDPEECGASILLPALAELDGVDLGASRSSRYVDAVGQALAHAWRLRDQAFRPFGTATTQTSHLCACDGDGMLVSMTFTHGPVWFGSGLMTAEGGILLNCGADLLARRARDGAIVAQPHLTPAIVDAGAVRYALGSPGGPRIPAIVLQAVIDLIHYRVPLEDALGAPRFSARAEGALEGERAIVEAFPERAITCIETSEYFGPAGALAWSPDGMRGAADPRFADGYVAVALRRRDG
ncbi:MAG: gamma-glutamyltransferase [Betaproteobacteria bacterium]|nr:gamma-glutamyltransferase [Betaproteobacteria bacterium]